METSKTTVTPQRGAQSTANPPHVPIDSACRQFPLRSQAGMLPMLLGVINSVAIKAMYWVIPPCCSCCEMKADSTLRSSQAIPHPSIGQALCSLTSEAERDPVHSTRYGRRRNNRPADSGRRPETTASLWLFYEHTGTMPMAPCPFGVKVKHRLAHCATRTIGMIVNVFICNWARLATAMRRYSLCLSIPCVHDH